MSDHNAAQIPLLSVRDGFGFETFSIKLLLDLRLRPLFGFGHSELLRLKRTLQRPLFVGD